ncbi:MAG TPA: hypothetical protein VMW89_15440 [Desulfatiglandales bacterium]|nr:hypothetical protein [Desulfatiglandales bacterium]
MKIRYDPALGVLGFIDGAHVRESSCMITAEEEKDILSRAYIPEHSVDLMTCVSGGEPFLIENYFCIRKGDGIIVVGYPLQCDFAVNEFQAVFDRIAERFRPKYASLIAPELPLSLVASCSEREIDHYYTLDIHKAAARSGLRRIINKARGGLSVERSPRMGEEHHKLTLEFIERVKPPPRVSQLLLRMPEYVGHGRHALALNAWDKRENLAAFYIIDLAPKDFSTYVIGCYSEKHYTPGASDLLLFELIQISMEYGKRYIHLGLGVNQGIQQFKKKWGGSPTRKYEMGELALRKPSILDAIRAK